MPIIASKWSIFWLQKNKDQLAEATTYKYSKLKKLLDGISSELALKPDNDGISIKDIVGHRAHWISLFLNWYAEGLARKEVHFPAKGYKWNQLNLYNEKLRESQKSLDWQPALEMLQDMHDKLVQLIDSMSNDQLYSKPMKGAYSKWTVGRWAEAAGPSHYRSAGKYIRARLRELT